MNKIEKSLKDIDDKFEIVGSNGKLASVKRPYKNDCWNVALALATNLPYEKIRKKVSNYINPDGSIKNFFIFPILEQNGYERVKADYKTIRTMSEDTKYASYEYVVSVSGHIVYLRKGIIYDSFDSSLRRVRNVYRRKINSRRKPIHKYLDLQEDLKC